MVSIGEIETQAVVWWIILAIFEVHERAVHTKMHRQPARWSEMDQEMLAVPHGLGDPRAFEALRQLAGRDACEVRVSVMITLRTLRPRQVASKCRLNNSTSGNSGSVSLRRSSRAGFFRNGQASIDGEARDRWSAEARR